MAPYREPEPIGLFIVGGGFLGLWLMIALMTRPEWIGWGLLGVGIGAGLYGGKLVPQQARFVLWTLVGVSIGGLVALALLQPHAGLLATLITLTGSAFIAGGIPFRGGHAAEEAVATPAAGFGNVHADGERVVLHNGFQGEGSYGQQQTVTVLRGR